MNLKARIISPIELYSGYYCNNYYNLIFNSPCRGKIQLFRGEDFVDEKNAKLMLKRSIGEREERNKIKVCAECPPKSFQQLSWYTYHYHGSAFDGATYSEYHCASIISDDFKLKVYELELRFFLNAKKRRQARRAILNNKDEDYLNQRLNLALFCEHKNPVYNYIYFTLCNKHSKNHEETADKIFNSLDKKERIDGFLGGYEYYRLYSLKDVKHRISRVIDAGELKSIELMDD